MINNVIDADESNRHDGEFHDAEEHHHEEDGSVVSSAFSNGGTKERAARLERKTLAKKENRAVSTLRTIVFSVLFLTAIGVSVSVYLISHNDEVDSFHEVFEAYATRVLGAFRESMESQLGVFDALSVTFTSYALATGSTFPNVTLPDFELRAANTRILSNGFLALFCPLVTNETKAGWEAYTAENTPLLHLGYENQGKYIAQQDKEFGLETYKSRPTPTNYTPELYPHKIYTNGPPSPFPDEYLFPLWQDSPSVPPDLSFLNFDISALRPGLHKTRITQKAHLDPIVEVTERLKHNVLSTLKDGQFRGNLNTYEDDPVSPFSYPVFDSFDLNTRQIVGVLATSLYWRLYWVNVLPPNAIGVICVLSDDKGTTHSYRIDGPTVTYLGEGDHHDTKFDDMAQSQELVEFVTNQASPETRGYTAAQVNPESTKHYLHVYPSNDLKDQHVTNQPIIFAVVVLMVFIFTSIVFVIYDYLVERRQTVVMDRAVKSTAVVSSLFPETVRDRLLQDDQGGNAGKATGSSSKTKALSEMDKGVLGASVMQSPASMSASRQVRESVDITTGTKIKFSGPPIADKFNEATVMFADIAGFTQWSSNREPEHVFHLLESLYGAFDEIALRRRVFKVETIGDCYMAVTGVPKPQPDHAILMARFALDCITKMKTLIEEVLSESLGSETSSLVMRVGLNSGEVTAGVLRGEKSRFQLFGDTVNTAARMESTGERGRIHCSESTADELIRTGKGNWVVPRENRITAKGKGEMQTYFIEIDNNKVAVGNASLNNIVGICNTSSDRGASVTKTDGTTVREN